MPLKRTCLARSATCALWLGAASIVGGSVAEAQSLPSIKLPRLPRSGGGTSSADTSTSPAPGDAAARRKEMRRQAELVDRAFGEIRAFKPDHRAFAADQDRAQADATQALEEFRTRMRGLITADLVAMATDAENGYTSRTAKQADGFATTTANTVSSVDLSRFRNSTGADSTAIFQYFAMVYRAEQMKQLAALFPGRAPIEAAQGVTGTALAELGSLESVKQGRAEAQAARIAAMRLAPAVRRDAGLEADFAAAFKRSVWTQHEFAGSQILRVNLISSGWTVRRNPVTGIILSRDQQADLAVKRTDGKCFSYVAVFEQKSQGSGFGGAYMASGRDLEMLCENATK